LGGKKKDFDLVHSGYFSSCGFVLRFPSSPGTNILTSSVNRVSIFSADLSRAGLALLGGLLLLVCGCGTSTKSAPAGDGGSSGGAGVSFSGKVLAGSQRVSGATVQLYAAGSTGYESAGTALLTSALTTNSAGGFTVPAGYMCPSSSTQVYLIARGGNPGERRWEQLLAGVDDCYR